MHVLEIGKGREKGLSSLSHKGTIRPGDPVPASIALKRTERGRMQRFLSKDQMAKQLAAGLGILLFKARERPVSGKMFWNILSGIKLAKRY